MMNLPIKGPRVAPRRCVVLSAQLALLFFGVLACPSAAFAQGCNSAELALVNRDGTPRGLPFAPYRLGETFAELVSGECFNELSAALKKRPLDRIALLYLNDVPMKQLPVLRGATDDASTALLLFELSRDPSDEESRAAWDKFLGAEDKADFNVEAGLSLDGAPIVSLAETSIEFGVASNQQIGLTSAAGGLFVVGAFLWLATRSGALLDDKNYFSLGRSQMAFWGLLVFAAICSLWSVTRMLEPIPNAVLTLLGISAATGLGSVAIDSSKRVEGSANKGKTRRGRRRGFSHFFSDIANDGNGLSIHRLQAGVWTLFLGWVFVHSVATRMSMPSFDDSLLILMGISSGTYLGFKFPEEASARAAEEDTSTGATTGK